MRPLYSRYRQSAARPPPRFDTGSAEREQYFSQGICSRPADALQPICRDRCARETGCAQVKAMMGVTRKRVKRYSKIKGGRDWRRPLESRWFSWETMSVAGETLLRTSSASNASICCRHLPSACVYERLLCGPIGRSGTGVLGAQLYGVPGCEDLVGDCGVVDEIDPVASMLAGIRPKCMEDHVAFSSAPE